MTASFFWYDFETTGVVPSRDRPIQVAGVRTNEALEEIEAPINLYCRLSDDILPHPAACLVTGIGPARLAEEGVCEAEFMARLHAQMIRPGTCCAGYNSLRFDDEVTRYGLYRNFHDPYAREWQGGNSRWDLIDLIRTAYALRPEGLEWPQEEGRVSLRLERLTRANGLEHGQAHDALSDVRATIALARLVRARQPRLYDYLYRLRRKDQVLAQVRLLEPVLHVSGRFSAERHFLSVVLPLAWHPRNRNALIVCDLGLDVSPLLDEPAETLRARLYTPRQQLLAEGCSPVPLKLLHVNRCPVVAPLATLREGDKQRLGLDPSQALRQAEDLRQAREVWLPKLDLVYAEEAAGISKLDDPEQRLYDGFLGERDRRLCEQVRQGEWSVPGFDDERLSELFFRYRARNFPESLDAAERRQWQAFCRARLCNAAEGAPITLAEFVIEARRLILEERRHESILQPWLDYARALGERYGVSLPGA